MKEINPGDVVIPKIGAHRGEPVVVIKVEFDAGAKNGWFTCRLPDGRGVLYAGEEIEKQN